jgi:hypothetical protein
MQNPVANSSEPSGTYVVEVGGKVDSQYGSFTAALKAGFELKNRNSAARVRVCGAAERG